MIAATAEPETTVTFNTPRGAKMTVSVHPATGLLPSMSDEQFARLKANIQATGGLVEPVVLIANQLVDGRHRVRACNELGLEVPTRCHVLPDGQTVEMYVIGSNYARRDLTTGQRLDVAVKYAESVANPGGKGTPKNSMPIGTEFKRAADKAAQLTGLSPRSINRGLKIKRADPDLFERVVRGEIAVSAAEEQLTILQRKAACRRGSLEEVLSQWFGEEFTSLSPEEQKAICQQVNEELKRTGESVGDRYLTAWLVKIRGACPECGGRGYDECDGECEHCLGVGTEMSDEERAALL